MNGDIGRRLQELRIDAGMTRKDLARVSNTGEATIANVEVRGAHPRPATLAKWAKALGVPISRITRGEQTYAVRVGDLPQDLVLGFTQAPPQR